MDAVECVNPKYVLVMCVALQESKLYGAHFKDVDHTQKATKISFDSDDDE